MITYNHTLNINTSAKTAVLSDLTPYLATYSINPTLYGGKVIGTITGPDGVAIVTGTVGSPLIDLAAGDTSSAAFNLPLGTDGEVLQGTYTLNLQVRFAGTGLALLSATAPSTITLNGVGGLANFIAAGDTITITGGVNAGAKTVATATPGTDAVFTVVQAVTTAGVEGTMAFDATHTATVSAMTYNGCTIVTPTVVVTSNCFSTQNGSMIFRDSTVLPSTHVLGTRAWSIEYPSNLSPAPAINPYTSTETGDNVPLNESITFNENANGPWGYRLTHTVTVTQTDGLVYTYVIDTGALNVTVSCNIDMCSINECMDDLQEQYDQDVAANKQSSLGPILTRLNTLYNVALGYQTCTNYEALAATLATMRTLLANSGCSCGCSVTVGNSWVNNAGQSQQSLFEQALINIAALQAIPMGELIYELSMPTNGANMAAEGLDAISIASKFVKTASVAHKHGIFIRMVGVVNNIAGGVRIYNETSLFEILNTFGGYEAGDKYEIEVEIVRDPTDPTLAYVKNKTDILRGVESYSNTNEYQGAWNMSAANIIAISLGHSTDTVHFTKITGFAPNA